MCVYLCVYVCVCCSTGRCHRVHFPDACCVQAQNLRVSFVCERGPTHTDRLQGLNISLSNQSALDSGRLHGSAGSESSRPWHSKIYTIPIMKSRSLSITSPCTTSVDYFSVRCSLRTATSRRTLAKTVTAASVYPG